LKADLGRRVVPTRRGSFGDRAGPLQPAAPEPAAPAVTGLRGQVQMALGMPSVKISGGSGIACASVRGRGGRSRRRWRRRGCRRRRRRIRLVPGRRRERFRLRRAGGVGGSPRPRCACSRGAGGRQRGEADLRVNLHHGDAGLAAPVVDLEQFAPQGERLGGHTGAGRLLVDRGRAGVVWGFQSGPDRSHEDGPPLWADRGAGELVGAAGPGVGQADGHVDRDDLDGSVGAYGGDELVDVGCGVGGGCSAGERDADPAGLAGIDSENPFRRHPAIIASAQ
jgi:hypothetical protein